MVDKKRLSKTVLSGVLAGGLLLGACGAALAGDASNAARINPAVTGINQVANFRPGGRDFMGTKLQSVLADLVKQGTLTQEQSTNLLDFLKQQKPDPGTPLGELVQQGILTQKEADAISQKMREAVQAEREKELRSALAALVAAGTIDESKADQLLTGFQKQSAQKENSGAADRGNTPKAQGPFGYAIEQGLLTQEQADALLKQMRAQDQSLRNEQLKAILEELVSAGTIEQSKADQVLSYLQKQETQHQAAAPGQAKGSNRVDPLSAAVSQGIITQQQADAIKNALSNLSGASAAHS